MGFKKLFKYLQKIIKTMENIQEDESNLTEIYLSEDVKKG